MNKKKFIKIVIISFIAVLFRLLLQLLIPASHQNILKPSIFIRTGTMQVAFIIYATLAYIATSSIFVFLEKNMSGSALSKGLKFGALFALLWAVYLLEPLPWSTFTDLISYPLADGAAQIVLGVLLGKFVASDSNTCHKRINLNPIISILIVTIAFFLERMFQYKVLNANSCLYTAPAATLIWVIATGIVIGFVFKCLISAVKAQNNFIQAIKFGFLVFGVYLFFFTYFMIIIGDFSALDLLNMLLRIFMDILPVTIGFYIALRLKK